MTEHTIIELSDFKLTNFDWSEDFDAQIKATMQRAQQVKQKEQELLITETQHTCWFDSSQGNDHPKHSRHAVFECRR